MTHSSSASQPTVDRPKGPEEYGIPANDEGLLQWSWAEEQLRNAANYWIGTVRPDGRPHSTPVWGVWLDGALYFDGSPETRRMKNIVANPEVAIHLESGDEVVILEGRAEAVSRPPGRELAEDLARIYAAKYVAHNYTPAVDQWDNGGLCAMRPRVALGWTLRAGEEFGKSYTRWRFAE